MNDKETKDAVDSAEAFLRTPIVHMLHLEWHKEKMKNPTYEAGFNSEDGVKNPFEMPNEIMMELWTIGRLEGRVKQSLSVRDNEELVALRNKLEGTDWQQWQWGHHARKYIKKDVDESE